MKEEYINELTPFLCSEDIQGFLKRAWELKNNTNPNDKWLGISFT